MNHSTIINKFFINIYGNIRYDIINFNSTIIINCCNKKRIQIKKTPNF